MVNFGIRSSDKDCITTKIIQMKRLMFLFSGGFMGLLLLTFASVIGYATFIENDFGAATARLLVYNTLWFESILFLMVVNFTGMIFTKHLYRKNKWNILIMHLAFVVIIVGAGVTRYFGSEGQMHIRNNETSNTYLSADNFLHIDFASPDFKQSVNEKVVLSTARENIFNETYQIEETVVKISVSEYIPNAVKNLVKSENGIPFVSLVVGNETGRQNVFLQEGEVKVGYDFGFSFGDTSQTELIQIIRKEGALFMRTPRSNDIPYEFTPLKIMTVHKASGLSFIVKEFVESAELKYLPAADKMQAEARMMKVQVNDIEEYLSFGEEKEFTVGNVELALKVDYLKYELPFKIKLNNFDLERYPGSNSPSSFASDITVIDELNKAEFPYRIYMNNILNYQGYRFFQSSYDKDQKGTVLSVNRDYWGTLISYVGYFFLFASLIMSFFMRNNRFARISKQLKAVHAKRKEIAMAISVLALMSTQNVSAQIESTFSEHSKSFGELYVQNNEGRIEPINTLANKVLVKISKKSSYKGLSADEFLLGVVANQKKWENELVIKVPEKSVQELIGISGSYASFSNFFDENGRYKIRAAVDHSYNKTPSTRTIQDKAIINVDERVNVIYMALNGSFLRILPLPDDENNKWVTPTEFHETFGHGNKNADLFETYLIDLGQAEISGDYSSANKSLDKIMKYQQRESGGILPSKTKAKLEIFYNETNIFKTLFPLYLIIGIVLVGLFFLQTFKPSLDFKILTRVFFTLLLVAFIAQTIGLVIRWNITGHAPWSNGYESMIYISWATVLAGFIFMKRSSVTLGVTATLAGITLLTAHMSWLNPELTNLVPVLKSYWLTIHVATITASYGFLGLGAMVAFLNLCFMIFRNKKNMLRVNLTVTELNLIIEMALSVGLILLIIGNFLGGIWANESWGRYWGWDPKETWTLVTIMLYTFTLHLVLIPSIRNTFSFSFLALVSFGGVLMTYFGVNYYLSGLHSYASGDPVTVPSFVYYLLVLIALISVLAAYNEFRMKREIVSMD